MTRDAFRAESKRSDSNESNRGGGSSPAPGKRTRTSLLPARDGERPQPSPNVAQDGAEPTGDEPALQAHEDPFGLHLPPKGDFVDQLELEQFVITPWPLRLERGRAGTIHILPMSATPLPADARPVHIWCKLQARDGTSADENGGTWLPNFVTGPSLAFRVPGPGRYRLQAHIDAGHPGARVLSRYIHVRRAGEETVAADQSERLVAGASNVRTGEDASIPSVDTYRDMLSAVLAAEQLTRAGDEGSYTHAIGMLEPIFERLHEIYPVLLDKRAERGFSKNAIDLRYGGARDGLRSWLGKLRMGSSINPTPWVDAFRAASKEIKLATGEKVNTSDLDALDDAAVTTATVVAVGATAVVVAPLAIEALAVIGIEAAGLQIGARLYTWAVANPQSALFLAEYLTATGLGVLDQGGPENYFRQIENNEDLAWAVMHTLTDLANARAGLPDDGPTPSAGRGRSQPGRSSRPQPTPDAGDSELAAPPRAGRVTGHEGEPTPPTGGRRTVIEEPIEIAGETHHLRVKQREDGTFEVALCSDCDAIRKKIQEVLATAPTKGPNKSLRTRLERLAAQVDDLETGLANGSIRHTAAVKDLNRIAGHLRDAYAKFPDAAQDLCVFCTFRARLDYDALAQSLGFERTGGRTHGQPIYQRGNTFISPDADGHNGGIWKRATGRAGNLDRKTTRDGACQRV